MISNDLKRAAVKTIMAYLRACGPAEHCSMRGELLAQCLGVTGQNVCAVYDAAWEVLIDGGWAMIEPYFVDDDGVCSYEVGRWMYNRKGEYVDAIEEEVLDALLPVD